jgi:transcriptional regulator with XRE-family HTH domain
MGNLKKEELTAEARRLKEFRKKEGFSQEAFADAMGVSHPLISRYENNRLNIPVEFVRELHDKLNMSTHWFFTGKGDHKYVAGKTNLVTDLKSLITSHNLLEDQVNSLKLELFKLHNDFHAFKHTNQYAK